MNEEQEAAKRFEEEHNKNVKWLRERVPPDDIYHFTQLMITAAEYIFAELGAQTDVKKLMGEDIVLNQWANFVMSIYFMKRDGYTGIISTDWKVGRK